MAEETATSSGRAAAVAAAVVAVIGVAVAGWILVGRATTVGEVLGAWLGGLGVIVVLMIVIGALGKGRQPPKVIGPLMALAVFAFALRGAVALFVVLF